MSKKITSFSDAVTLTFDLRPWKVNQVRTLSLPMCIPNLRTIHPVILSYRVNTIAGGGRLRRKTITSPDPSDTGDIMNNFSGKLAYQGLFCNNFKLYKPCSLSNVSVGLDKSDKNVGVHSQATDQ